MKNCLMMALVCFYKLVKSLNLGQYWTFYKMLLYITFYFKWVFFNELISDMSKDLENYRVITSTKLFYP